MSKNNHTEYWEYNSQPRSEWPNWLLFTNHASNVENTLLFIHVFDDILRIETGDTLIRRTDGYLSVKKGQRNK